MKMRTFDNTRKALIEFDAGAAERQRLWDSIESNQDVEAAVAADNAAKNKVREAFYEDTKDINSKENCMCVEVDFMRRLASARP